LTFVIDTFSLSRRFGDQLAVDAVSLRVPEGSVYGFLGPNGAGKTTTIRMLLGLIQPTNGEIRLFDQSLQGQQILRRVGAMVEGPSLYPNLTGHENLEVTRRLIGVSKQRIAEVLEVVDLTDAADKLVRAYSLGMKQRLGIALALLSEPELLILDEPTNGLDPAGIREIRTLIRELPQQVGTTVFLSSHLLSEVEQVASHIGIIHQGRLIFQDTLAVLQHERREQIHVGAFNPEIAVAVLEQAGYQVQLDDELIRVDMQGRKEAAQVNRSLVQSQQDVFHLVLEKLSLEDVFLKLTGEVFPDDNTKPSTVR
jgi:lantibiotic transport system ATP-binding protein